MLLTEKINACIAKAIADPKVRQAIKVREDHPGIGPLSIKGKVMPGVQWQGGNIKMVVRVEFDFIVRVEDGKEEDFFIYVEYRHSASSNAESFRLSRIYFIPEVEVLQ